MALAVRRSILEKYFLVFSCLFALVCALIPPALAQHYGGRVAGAPAPAPPVMHAPVYRAPTYQIPIYRAPSYTPVYAPRISTGSAVRAFGLVTIRPPFRPIRPFPPIVRYYIFPVNSAFWPSNFCWWATCEQFWTSALLYNSIPNDLWNPANSFLPPPTQTPVYVYGEERPDNPQLFLKDGTSLYVTDYWVVDDQLHFIIAQEDGVKPEEQVIPFDELDLQKTVDVNTNRGFRFMLRNEPFEQYVRDHPEGPPATLKPRPQ